MNDHVVPFALGAILAALGAACAEMVRRRTIEYAPRMAIDESKAEALVVWGADAAQAFVATAAPVTTGLLLVEDTSSVLAISYCALMVIGLVLFGAVLYQRPDDYSGRRVVRITLVTWVGIGLNVLAGALVQILA